MNPKSKIDIVDLKTQQDRIRPSLERRMARVLEHGQYIMGPEVEELEKLLASYTGAKHCVSCSNGTDALQMVLMAYDIKPGDLIITTPFTFFATAEVIALLGAETVFVDIEANTFNMDPVKLKETVTRIINSDRREKLKGIIPVDLFGLPANYVAINAIAKEHGLFVLADGAQSFGGQLNGKRVGSLTDVTTTSFFPAKPLGCYGDGGAIFCDDDALAAKLRSIRVHGKGSDKYDNVRIGVNGRLDTLQAAVLLAKMEVFESELAAKNKLADYYKKNLSHELTAPTIPSGYLSAFAQYTLRSSNRAEYLETLKKNNIGSVVYYPTPLHLSRALANLGYKEGSFPVSERAAHEVFSIPMNAYLSEVQQKFIVESLSNPGKN